LELHFRDLFQGYNPEFKYRHWREPRKASTGKLDTSGLQVILFIGGTCVKVGLKRLLGVNTRLEQNVCFRLQPGSIWPFTLYGNRFADWNAYGTV